MTQTPQASTSTELNWRATPMSGKWLADTPLGIVTVAFKRVGKNRGSMWQATLPDGVRIATGDTSQMCMRDAEFHVARLARLLSATAQPAKTGGEG
jgi:hypothetical protein